VKLLLHLLADCLFLSPLAIGGSFLCYAAYNFEYRYFRDPGITSVLRIVFLFLAGRLLATVFL